MTHQEASSPTSGSSPGSAHRHAIAQPVKEALRTKAQVKEVNSFPTEVNGAGMSSVLPPDYSYVEKPASAARMTGVNKADSEAQSREAAPEQTPKAGSPKFPSPKRLIPMAKPRVAPNVSMFDMKDRGKPGMRGHMNNFSARQFSPRHDRYGNFMKGGGKMPQYPQARSPRDRELMNRISAERNADGLSRPPGLGQNVAVSPRRMRNMPQRSLTPEQERQLAIQRKVLSQKKKFSDEYERNLTMHKIRQHHHKIQMDKQMRDMRDMRDINLAIQLREAQNKMEKLHTRGEFGSSRADAEHLKRQQLRRMVEAEVASFGAECRMGRFDADEEVQRREAAMHREHIRSRAAPMQGRGDYHGPGASSGYQNYRNEAPVDHQGAVPGGNGPWIPPNPHVTSLPTVELATDDVDDRQLVAKEVNVCKQNTRTLLHRATEILILAESDFSFSSALVEHTPEDCHMVATSFESEEKLQDFHKEKFDDNVKLLRSRNATVLHDVDCTCLEETLAKAINRKSPEEIADINKRWSGHFDIVWLQLPHTGGTAKTNSNMINRFLNTVGRVLKPDGLVFLTLYGMQVDHWKIALHARTAQMAPVLKVPFNTSVYPAIWTRYNPKVGFSNGFFDILRHPCDTFVFAQNEFTCVSKLKAVDPKILNGLRTVRIHTINDLADADKRLLSNDVDPKFLMLIRQAKAWLIVWKNLKEVITSINPGLQVSKKNNRYADRNGGHGGYNNHHNNMSYDKSDGSWNPMMKGGHGGHHGGHQQSYGHYQSAQHY